MDFYVKRLVSAALGVLFAAGVLVPPVVARAQDAGDLRTFGTTGVSVYTLHSSDFETLTGTDVFGANAAGKVCVSGTCQFFAAARLPEGAVLFKAELEACDTNSTLDVGAAVYRVPAPYGAQIPVGAVNTGALIPEPGCQLFAFDISPAQTIDNRNNTYLVQVATSPDVAQSVGFQAVRFFYRLQVSPAPATATFGDVPPTHPFFRFVEALAKAGITGGCGGGNYCPDQPVTRGQMATFLSLGLGLHFPATPVP